MSVSGRGAGRPSTRGRSRSAPGPGPRRRSSRSRTPCARPGGPTGASQGLSTLRASRASGRVVAEVAPLLMQPTGRRVAVDELLAGAGDAVRPSAAADEHDVGVDRHGRNGPREERQGRSVVASEVPDPVEPRGTDVEVGELGERLLRVVQRRVDGSVRERHEPWRARPARRRRAGSGSRERSRLARGHRHSSGLRSAGTQTL